MNFYVSKQWINKFNTFSEPGPISNNDFLCKHGGKKHSDNRMFHIESARLNSV